MRCVFAFLCLGLLPALPARADATCPKDRLPRKVIVGTVCASFSGTPEARAARAGTLADELAEKARAGKLTPNEMKGGTFTISNMGMMNVESFQAIVNPGESAILAVASCIPTPVVRNGEIVVRDIMKITVSADHRIVDGAMAAAFANCIRAKLEDAALWDALI